MSVDATEPSALAEAAALPWRGGFGRLWSAAVVSRFGDGLRGAALPLLATSLTTNPLLISLVTAAGYLPWIVFGLLGGAVADRVDQRRAMRSVDAVRALLTGAFALTVALGHASITLLLVLAFALTTLQTLFDNAATALLPAVVPTTVLGRANSRLMTGQTIASAFIAAPLVAALLALSAGAPFAVDAASFAVAAALVASLPIPVRERPPRPAGRTLRRDMAEGLRTLWRDRVLRSLCAANTVANIGVGALVATLVLQVTGWLHAGHGGFAAVITAYGIGSVFGGAVAGRLGRWLGTARALAAGLLVQTGCLAVLGSVRSLAAAITVMAVFGALGMVWNVSEVTLLQERTPMALLGRVSAANRTLSVAGAPLGALLGGAAASAWGLNAPALVAAALFTCASGVLIPALVSFRRVIN
ncbi:MFS transporter [Actinacidiphila alni]|uniref:MFS transporter n=1 Tax=Actinacidiphila alni TaxID=380248 RepID=UPI0033D83E92